MRCVIFWSPPGSEPCGSCDYTYPVEYESKEKLENDFLALALNLREEWDAYESAHAIWQEQYSKIALKASKARKPGVVGPLEEEAHQLYLKQPQRPEYDIKFLGEEFGCSDLFPRDYEGKVYENFPEFHTLDEWFEKFQKEKS